MITQIINGRREDAARITALEQRVTSIEGKAWGLGVSAKAAWAAVIGVVDIGVKMLVEG